VTDRPSFADLAERIDAAERAARALDEPGRLAAEAWVAALDDLHREVLVTIVTTLKADERGRELLFGLVDDPAVHAVLAMHGIVRPTVAMRAVRVLDAVRPYLTGHGGDVELVRIEGTVAFVRMTGACKGCGSAAATLRDGIAEAMLANIPELTEVQAVPDDPAPAAAFIPVGSVTRRTVAEAGRA
jgi:Fe-S cluster biogenesis protein NfuA